jgi:hypothetical protein
MRGHFRDIHIFLWHWHVSSANVHVAVVRAAIITDIAELSMHTQAERTSERASEREKNKLKLLITFDLPPTTTRSLARYSWWKYK